MRNEIGYEGSGIRWEKSVEEAVAEIDQKISELKTQAETDPDAFDEITRLKQKRDQITNR